MSESPYLSQEQLETFLTDGVLVVDNVLTETEIETALDGLSKTLARCGVDCKCWDEASGRALAKLSSTNGSGGVLDLFYDDWKMKIATNPKLFAMTTELWKISYCHQGESHEKVSNATNDFHKWHPHGPFDSQQGFMYIDRIGYRLPTKLSDELGAMVNSQNTHNSETTAKKKKMRSLQRSLTPHLDCCPTKLYEGTSKWRPIQCFVSLTDNTIPNTGGFEAAKGFHRTFHVWSQERKPTIVIQKQQKGKATVSKQVPIQPPCLGEYTHIRPKEDQNVMEQIAHIPVRAGSAVFWDNRIPHANSYRHDGTIPRVVVYCSYMPNVPINQVYVQAQLSKWICRQPPTDQWNNIDIKSYSSSAQATNGGGGDDDDDNDEYPEHLLTDLGRKLIGLDPW